MQSASFRHSARVSVLVGIALVAAALLAFALISGGSATAQAAAHHAKAQHARHAAVSSTEGQDSQKDTDNVQFQSGDQSSPDTTASGKEKTSDGESSTESSGDAPGDQQPAGGGANAEGDCTGNCVQ